MGGDTEWSKGIRDMWDKGITKSSGITGRLEPRPEKYKEQRTNSVSYLKSITVYINELYTEKSIEHYNNDLRAL